MPSPPPQRNSPPSQSPPASFERLEISTEGQKVHSQLEHTASFGRVSSKSGGIPTIAQGTPSIQLDPTNQLSPLGHRTTRDVTTSNGHAPGDVSNAKSVSSGPSSKSGFRKRLSRLFKGAPKVNEAVPTSAVTVPLVGTKGRIQSAAPDCNAVPVSLRPRSLADPVETSSTMIAVPATQVRPSPAEDDSIRMNIFPENVANPTYKTDLPKPHERVDKTPQLVYCCSLLSKAQGPVPPTSDSDFSQDSSLDDKEKEWVQLIDPVVQDQYQRLVKQLVKAFADDTLKAFDRLFLLVPSLTAIYTAACSLALSPNLSRQQR
ncbi:MAG: hypothetical protein JOS17DRAFT_772743 [Linnemannia elongata]|nr:MAG: hypothetical protein JOS17DRAFT_772743 [Linnemannia elongata]